MGANELAEKPQPTETTKLYLKLEPQGQTSKDPMPASPAQTIIVLEELCRLGFSDTAFRRLHHLGAGASISAHRGYCEKLLRQGSGFRQGSRNGVVQRRLECVLGAYRGGGFASTSPAVFDSLASAAVAELSMVSTDERGPVREP